MSSGSGSKKGSRHPRVNIAYANPHTGRQDVELPFVMAVMGDLSGNNPGVEKAPVSEREFRPVTKDSLDPFMASVKPGLNFSVDNRIDPSGDGKMGIELEFNMLKDLEPAAIARQVPAMRKLLEAREHLAELKRYLNSKPKAQQHVKKLLDDPDLLRALAESAETNEA